MSRKKIKKQIVVNTKELLAGIQALNVFYEEKLSIYTSIKDEYGENSPAALGLLDEITTLGDILNFFTSLTGDQLKDDGGHFN